MQWPVPYWWRRHVFLFDIERSAQSWLKKLWWSQGEHTTADGKFNNALTSHYHNHDHTVAVLILYSSSIIGRLDALHCHVIIRRRYCEHGLCSELSEGKGKGSGSWYSTVYMRELVSSSHLQSWQWQLIGMTVQSVYVHLTASVFWQQFSASYDVIGALRV